MDWYDEQYIKEYDDLYNFLQELTSELERQKTQKRKVQEEFDE
jgi:hypothetical protein